MCSQFNIINTTLKTLADTYDSVSIEPFGNRSVEKAFLRQRERKGKIDRALHYPKCHNVEKFAG